MAQRIFSTVLLWSIILGGFWFSGNYAPVFAVALLTILSALTLHEFYTLIEKMGYKPFRWFGVLIAVLITTVPFYVTYHFEDPLLVDRLPELLVVAVIIISCFRVLGERDTSNRVETIGSTVIGVVCVPYLLQYMVRILTLESDAGDNLILCVWVVAVSKFCDVGALLTGLAFGKHKMCPTISPKKTWEGAVGGVLISAGIGAGISFFASEHLPSFLTPGVAALVALPMAITTIVSDLMESAVKRRADIKDAGKLIPGIGGAFDLTDSLLLTAPLAYYIFVALA